MLLFFLNTDYMITMKATDNTITCSMKSDGHIANNARTKQKQVAYFPDIPQNVLQTLYPQNIQYIQDTSSTNQLPSLSLSSSNNSNTGHYFYLFFLIAYLLPSNFVINIKSVTTILCINRLCQYIQ